MAERISLPGVQPRPASRAVRPAASSVAASALALALAAVALLAGAGVAHGDGDERVRYDGGAVLVPAGPAFPLPLAIDFFTDDLGPPAAAWPAGAVPVEFCTFHNNRPAVIGAEQFRQAMRDVAAAWNATDAAVGIRYAGDCTAGFRWEFDNDRNEVGFDDARNAASGDEVGLARGVWFEFPAVGTVQRREFAEFDVVLAGDELADVPFVCFVSVLSHEVGHTLGLGHSDTEGDLMFESFTPSQIETCPTAPSAAERARLQDLYGTDRAPTVNAGADRVVDTAASVTLTASGVDPEGRTLTFQWAQLSGPAVQLSASGAAVSFATPSESGVTLVFEVTALDPFLHAATDAVSVTVGAATGPPVVPPGFLSFLPGPSGAAEIGWSEVSGASSYEFCQQIPGAPSSVSCGNLSAPLAAITWDVTLGAQGPASATRVLTGGERDTWLRGCNSKGCTVVSPGPLAGGLRWPAWGMDYDYFAMAFDFGRLRFTLIGVVNISGPNRVFNLNTGPPDNPTLHRIRPCGQLPAGRACIAFLGLNDEHFEVASIVSKSPGTPTTEHRITIR